MYRRLVINESCVPPPVQPELTNAAVHQCFTLAMCAVQCGNSGCLANVESLGGWVGESLLVSGRSMLIAQSCICNSGAAMQWGNGQ